MKPLPLLRTGLGLKPQHFQQALEQQSEGLWFEIHPENYMMAGGPRLAWLDAVRSRHPLSLHSVSLSLGADAPLDPTRLAALRRLVDRLEPALVSEHLAWSAWRGAYYPDLLPIPRTTAALARIVENVQCMQEALGRPIALENPSHYLRLDQHAWDEIDFLEAIAARSGCRLLLDINNVFVSSRNLGFCATEYVDRFPAHAVAEIHLAGHRADDDDGARHGERPGLLIDSHDESIAPEVWRLYERFVERFGARPTLIERDDRIPAFDELLAERQQAEAVVRRAGSAP
jgi:hypothetical protein